MKKRSVIKVDGAEIALFSNKQDDYISLTDIAKYRDENNPFQVVANWMRSYATIEFLGTWEKLNNPNFKPLEFERFKNEAGANYFVMNPKKWVKATIGGRLRK